MAEARDRKIFTKSKNRYLYIGEVRRQVFYKVLKPEHILEKPYSAFASGFDALKSAREKGARFVHATVEKGALQGEYYVPIEWFFKGERWAHIDRGYGIQRAIEVKDWIKIESGNTIEQLEELNIKPGIDTCFLDNSECSGDEWECTKCKRWFCSAHGNYSYAGKNQICKACIDKEESQFTANPFPKPDIPVVNP